MDSCPAAWTSNRFRSLPSSCVKRPLLFWRVLCSLPLGLRCYLLRQVPVPTVEKELLEGENGGERACTHYTPKIRQGRNLERTVSTNDEGPSRGSPASRESTTDMTRNELVNFLAWIRPSSLGIAWAFLANVTAHRIRPNSSKPLTGRTKRGNVRRK